MGCNRTRKKRSEIKRRRAREGRVTATADTAVEPTADNVRGLLTDPKAVRTDLYLITQYATGAQFSESEMSSLIRMVGTVAATSTDPKIKLQAFKSLLALGDLNVKIRRLEMDSKKGPARHEHIHAHIQPEQGTDRVSQFAARLGIGIDVREDGE